VVGPVVVLAPTTPAPPPAEEGSHFRSGVPVSMPDSTQSIVDVNQEGSAKENGVDKSIYLLLNISPLLALSALLSAGYKGLIIPETLLNKRHSWDVPRGEVMCPLE